LFLLDSGNPFIWLLLFKVLGWVYWLKTNINLRKFYCTVSLTVLEWGIELLHRQAARGARCIWRLAI
jgi:hypothetical protein